MNELAEFTIAGWDFPPTEPPTRAVHYGGNSFDRKDDPMLASIIASIAGERLAPKDSKVAGALVGAALPMIARRGFGPLGLAIGVGLLAKKAYDKANPRGRSAA